MHYFWLFVITSFLLIILPGPDTAVATKNTWSMGRTGGLKTIAGTCCAVLLHTVAAVVGLSTIIVKSAFLFSVFKYAGAAYLVYVGIKTFCTMFQQQPEEVEESVKGIRDHTSCFKQGFFTNLLNPKVAVFFLTFLPQFVDPGENTFLPFLVMGITYCIVKAVWFVFYVYMIESIRGFMKKPRVQVAFEGGTGLVFIGFGIKLALEKVRQ